MKLSTKARILNNSRNGCWTIIGRYAYRVHCYTGEIFRAKRADVGGEWLDDDGRVHSAWEGTGEYV